MSQHQDKRPGEPEDRAGRRQGRAKPRDTFKLENRIGHLLDTIGLDEIEAAQPRPRPPGRTAPPPRARPDANHREGAD